MTQDQLILTGAVNIYFFLIYILNFLHHHLNFLILPLLPIDLDLDLGLIFQDFRIYINIYMKIDYFTLKPQLLIYWTLDDNALTSSASVL